MRVSYSPEVMPNGARDYSVYVLDPLESGFATNSLIGAASSSAPHSQPTGVAIGLGLMSWAWNDQECKVMVNGTITDDPSRGEMLEVVFAMREVSNFSTHEVPLLTD